MLGGCWCTALNDESNFSKIRYCYFHFHLFLIIVLPAHLIVVVGPSQNVVPLADVLYSPCPSQILCHASPTDIIFVLNYRRNSLSLPFHTLVSRPAGKFSDNGESACLSAEERAGVVGGARWPEKEAG